jgi:hypothetical protein
MLRRHPTHTFLLVAPGGYPIAVLRGLPRPERLARIAQGEALVYDLGRLPSKEHARVLQALATLKGLPYLAEGAPTPLLVGGEPAMVIDGEGKQVHGGIGGRLYDLIRDSL